MRKKTGIGAAIAIGVTLACSGAAAQQAGISFANDTAAQSYIRLTSMLETNGYTVTAVERTMLGRYRILASNGVHVREIVLSRTTGEIKHDAVVGSASGGGNGSANAKGGNSNKGRGNNNAGGNGNGNSGGGNSGGGNSGGNGNGNSGGGGGGNGKGK